MNFLLLQHRELVSATAGYSSIELVYGKNIRDGLYLARQVWENPDKPQASEPFNKDVVKYMEELKSKLRTAIETSR